MEKTQFKKRIRRLRRLYYGQIAAFLPLQFLLGGMIHTSRLPLWSLPIFAIVLFVSIAVVYIRLNGIRCPRCNSHFFTSKLARAQYSPFDSVSFPMATTCQHCGWNIK